jgi:hypothetical protein
MHIIEPYETTFESMAMIKSVKDTAVAPDHFIKIMKNAAIEFKDNTDSLKKNMVTFLDDLSRNPLDPTLSVEHEGRPTAAYWVAHELAKQDPRLAVFENAFVENFREQTSLADHVDELVKEEAYQRELEELHSDKDTYWKQAPSKKSSYKR